MATDTLHQHREILLALGRRTLELSTPKQANDAALRYSVYSSLGLEDSALPSAIMQPYACFVTLIDQPSGLLRGCIGTLTARMPLADEVIHSTYETAFHDPRFVPVMPDEVPELRLELSILTPAQALPYSDPAQLPGLLRPHVDGVTLFIGERKATFLPQVWEKLSDPILFLESLCHKMGLPRHAWRDPQAHVETYQALKLAEDTHPTP